MINTNIDQSLLMTVVKYLITRRDTAALRFAVVLLLLFGGWELTLDNRSDSNVALLILFTGERRGSCRPHCS